MKKLQSSTALTSGTLTILALGVGVTMAQSINEPINYDEAPINGQFENTDSYSYDYYTTNFEGSGDFIYSNSGDINQIGNTDDFLFAPALSIFSGDLDEDGNIIGGNLTLSNTGGIKTFGRSSAVVNADAAIGSITFLNQGHLTTLGDYSAGARFKTGVSSNCIDVDGDGSTPCIEVQRNDGGNIVGENAGNIYTLGNGSIAIEAISYGAEIDIQNLRSADIKTSGWEAHGISAESGLIEVGPHEAVNLGGAVSITNKGDIFINGGRLMGFMGRQLVI